MTSTTHMEQYFEFPLDLVRDTFFRDDTMIAVKQRIHNRYRTNPKTLMEHLVECLDLADARSLLDLGCGNAFILEHVARQASSGTRLVGLDVAPGVLAAAAARFAEQGLDAEWIESSADHLSMLATDSFDRAMANYMMHYVPDIDACLHEVARVLRPGGVFVLSTDSIRSMAEMYEVHFAALRRLGWPERFFKGTPKGRISLENGEAQLGRVFEDVRVQPYEDALRFEVAEPFLEFYAVGHNYCCARAATSSDVTPVMFEELLADVRSQVEATIARDGFFQITKVTGSFVCRR